MKSKNNSIIRKPQQNFEEFLHSQQQQKVKLFTKKMITLIGAIYMDFKLKAIRFRVGKLNQIVCVPKKKTKLCVHEKSLYIKLLNITKINYIYHLPSLFVEGL